MQTLVRQLEALLFVAARPLEISELARAAHAPTEDIAAALELLQGELSERGIQLIRSHHSAELVSAPDLASLIQPFLQHETRSPLSKPALETLAIVLHRQPVTKQEIESIRGVASDQTIRNLLGRGLIEETGSSTVAGRPPQYGTGTTLLRHLGITSLEELPLKPDSDAR